ncbi:MAG: LysR family transcriptional regulator [Pseudomonadales bacterium]|jgi:DNA-binding transcriptional LysR family regulator|nr:LysR family transcriptional regulator [Pseudomonadales bacterium]MDP6317441.1 LysR family transcriptional regulator [Pseudomonadales bacterium]MDP7316364.1 LysR family transcriptional regulator [Pseudomonadales bacterium]MDP7577213.1 LysR family transcriptional regulator [Pseudomonadales bacterium]HJP50870.1 LysR family transcriptional regulator [Pseudomonadales bacterium]|tara:strand:+ start:789 stop:1676 length:888 start_codon:yes stop_codon:yes gene_type:complete
MIENLETLLALSRTGTMLEASTELRISQSAVSKRIAVLEKYYDRKLIQKKGRRVALTQHGQQLVDKLSPILSELRDLFVDDGSAGKGELIVGVSEAILSSWGPGVFFKVQQEMPDVHFAFHTHRTPVVLDRIRSGEFMVGVCTGSDSLDKDLQSEVLFHEPMVIIPSGLRKFRWSRRDPLDVITIEDYSGAWRSFKGDAERLNIRRVVSLESFFSVAQMAITGFGHGLVPIGVAKTLKVDEDCLIDLGSKGLSRPVRFVARKSTYAIPIVTGFYQSLVAKLDGRSELAGAAKLPE